MPTLLVIIVSSVFVNNFVLSRFLGICPFLGVSKKIETALGMGMAVTFVMTLASAFSYMVYNWILVPTQRRILYTPSPSFSSSHPWYSLWRWSFKR